MVHGSCLCGRFAFEVDGDFGFMSHCHCGYCRKAHGAAFATYVGAPASAFRWLRGQGEQAFYESSPGAKRPFCPDCGSKVPGPASGDQVFFPAGLLDGDPRVRPMSHMFAGSKAPWFEIQDGLPAFESVPPGMTDPKLPARPRPRQARAGAGAIAGSCLCGAVAWEADELLPRMGSCHCSRCRKVRSAAFSTQVFSAHERFRWLSGKERIRQYQLPGALLFGNSFCSGCGSPVPRDDARAPMVLIPAGSLDDDPTIRPQAHIFVASKAPWYEIPDSLPRFAEMPTG
jgi:hypothetical protein